MNKLFWLVAKPLGVAVALSIGCCSAVFAQGMSEYAGVMAMPKPVPSSKAVGGTLNSLYGASGKGLNSVAAAAGGAKTASASKASAAPAKGAKPKPAVIMSGDLPGSAIQAQREVVLGVSKVANETYKAGMDAKAKGKLSEAEVQLRKSVNARQQYWSDRDRKIPDILVELGELNATKGDDKKAVEDLQSALAFYGKFHGPGSVHRLKPLLLLSESQYRLGEKVPSYDSYKQAYLLATRAKLDAYNPVELRLKTIQKAIEVGKNRDACEMAEAATSTTERAKLSQEQLLTVMNDYATALKGLNRNRDAEEVLAEAEKIRGGSPAVAPAPENGSPK